MADNSHRSNSAGIDLITYQTQVKQVVVNTRLDAGWRCHGDRQLRTSPFRRSPA